jgi:hypothetical protein
MTSGPFDTSNLIKTLEGLGYSRFGEGAFQCQELSTVKHRLYFQVFRRDGRFVSVDFGLFHPVAHQFAIDTILKYGASTFKLQPQIIQQTDCFVRFSFWRLNRRSQTYAWPVNEVLYANIADGLATDYEPFRRSVPDLSRFLDILSGDAEPCPWLASNGVIRAAELVAVGRILKTATSTLGDLLDRRKAWFAELQDGMMSDEFIDRLLTDSQGLLN